MTNVAKALVYLPSGVSDADKKKLIGGVKEALSRGFGMEKQDSRVYLINRYPENTCPNFAQKLAVNVYLPMGKSDDEKTEFAVWYKKAVDDTFGEAVFPAFLTIDEHSLDNEYLDGSLLSRA